jgi:hypothetical protein
MTRSLPWVVAFLLVASAGAVHGWRTDRWSISDEPAASAAKLEGLPLSLGDWRGTEEEMDAEQRELAEITGYKLRVYQFKNRVVRVMIACGRPGPISVHTPDVCMGGAGFEIGGESTETIDLGNGLTSELRMGRFRRDVGPQTVQQRILWSWSTDGTWIAPESPRWNFARAPALYKLYLTYDLPRPDEPIDAVFKDFLKLLLLDLHARLARAS